MNSTANHQPMKSASPAVVADFRGQRVDAAEFRRLLVSHRRLIRADRRSEHLRGLKDLDTGELFLIDERRLS
ncbi:MAG: hypothetical protein IT424_13595 [Pirellulales bacterium]|nr:hypothetical protein [Pirellulales bacterium]